MTTLMDRVLKGGYPEALRRTQASRRQAWLEDYVALILDRDVRDIANIDQVDLVIEDRRGRVIGIEVKASATVRPQDLRGLRQLQEAVGDKFVQWVVLHDHDRITPFDEKLHAAPVSLLWQAAPGLPTQQ